MVPAQRAADNLSKPFWIALFITLINLPASAFALNLEGAVGYYKDDTRTTETLSESTTYKTDKIFDDHYKMTSFNLGITLKRTEFADEKQIPEPLDGEPTMQENSFSLGIDQGLNSLTRVGALVGTSQSPLNKSTWYGARVGRYWLKETLETTLEVRKTTTTQDSYSVTDTDAIRVTFPANIEGINYSLGINHFATPTTITRANFSYTTRTDRPPASLISLEVRQYITPTLSSLHLTAMHYSNSGEIRPVTLTGNVEANSFSGEWHQRFLNRFIGMVGYRYYIETEVPRAEGAETKQLGSDYIYGHIRLRFGEGSWQEDKNEVYLFGGRYTTNEPMTGYIIGIGGQIFL